MRAVSNHHVLSLTSNAFKDYRVFPFGFFLTQFPVCVASVIESDRDSVSVGCGLVTMTPQSSFWKARDSGQRPTVTVQLFAVVKHLNSGSRVKEKKKGVQANPGNHCG